jgi:ribosomal protein S18 acetylase RimI-like enzyme
VHDIEIVPVTEPEFPVVRGLAERIWRQHYEGIISAAQIEFMLAGRLTSAKLRDYVGAADRWLELIAVAGTPVGYVSCACLPAHPGDMKLEQLYLLDTHRSFGLGRRMLAHVESRARKQGRGTLFLQVNKRNALAIGFYRAMGFTVREEAVFEIGNGFVMDDYVMEKAVPKS